MSSQQDTKLMPEKEALGNYLNALLDETPVVINEVNVAAESIQPASQESPEPITDTPFASKKNEGTLPPIADWTQSEFPAVLVKVEKLVLALPLCTLRQMIKVTDEDSIRSVSDEGLIGQFMGSEKTVAVLNATQIILGKATDNSQGHKGKTLIISTDGVSGILVDAVMKEMNLRTSEVKHRKNPANRLWLLGTLPKHNAALIDIRTLKKAEGQLNNEL
ncbi:MAG: hypothetical protein V3U75_12435 [Methylococcaceae bacterium]